MRTQFREKTQISQYIHAIWSDSLPQALNTAKGPKLCHVVDWSDCADVHADMCLC